MAKRVRQGDRRAVARLITLVECEDPAAEAALAELYPHTGQAYLVGITGPPGAGKSSLTDLLIAAIRADGLSVGVVAVDPASPFSGGAILGDRIRMKQHASDPGVFIRSMSSRGQLGGIARATRAACEILDAHGCQVILVETVGVGQSEVAIAQATDCTVLVLPPNLGDGIQAIKAGIMEVPDLFVVNKADLVGADQAVSEILGLLEMGTHEGWVPPVMPTRSLEDLAASGASELWRSLQEFRAHLTRSGELSRKRLKQAAFEVESLALGALTRELAAALAEPEFVDLLDQVQARACAPGLAVRRLLERLRP